MPEGSASGTTGRLHDLYRQAEANRKKAQLLAGELQATRLKASENWRLIRAAWERTERIRAQRLAGSADPDWLRYSAYARVQARLASMPVIEQAKGILMARYGWHEDQAFEALRRASRRENTRVRELAARIVARAARQRPAPRSARPAVATAHAGSPSREVPAVPGRSRAAGPGSRPSGTGAAAR